MFKLLRDLFCDKPVTFDDVASQEAKDARAAIYAKAHTLIMHAAKVAADGDVVGATIAQRDYRDLASLALSVTLDMIESERRVG